jgi:ankyrin repeat protein
MITHGASIERSNNDGETPLFLAAEVGNKDIVDILLKNDANINSYNKMGETPLFGALYHNHALYFIKYLLEHGADISVKNSSGKTLLYQTMFAKNALAYAKLFMQHGAQVNTSTKDGNTSLHAAASLDKLDLVTFLVSNGAYIDQRNNQDETPLFKAVAMNAKSVVKYLINVGAKINSKNILEKTPLHLAVQSSNASLVIYLLKQGADHSIMDKYGNAPFEEKNNLSLQVLIECMNIYKQLLPLSDDPLIYYAIKLKSEKLVEHLMPITDVLHPYFSSKNLLDLALKHKALSLIEFFLKQGMHIKYYKDNLLPHFIPTLIFFDTDLLSRLLQAGLSVNACHKKTQTTMLHQICAGGYNDEMDYWLLTQQYDSICSLLLSHGATITQNIYRETPLHVSSAIRPTIIRRLINAGVPLEARNQENQTVLAHLLSLPHAIKGLILAGISSVLPGSARECLHWASITNQKELIDLDTINTPEGHFKATALHYVAAQGDEQLVSLFLKNKACHHLLDCTSYGASVFNILTLILQDTRLTPEQRIRYLKTLLRCMIPFYHYYQLCLNKLFIQNDKQTILTLPKDIIDYIIAFIVGETPIKIYRSFSQKFEEKPRDTFTRFLISLMNSSRGK